MQGLRKTSWAQYPSFPARFLSHLRGDFLGKGFPGRAWWSGLVQPSVSGSQQDFPGGTHASLPFLQGPVQDSHRVLLHQRVEPEEAQDSSGKETSSHLTGLSIHTCISPYVDKCRDRYMSVFPDEFIVIFPRDWRLTYQLAEFGKPCHRRQA